MKRDVVGPELMATGAERKDAHDRHLRDHARTRAHPRREAPPLRYDRAPPHRAAGDRHAELLLSCRARRARWRWRAKIVPNINRLAAALRAGAAGDLDPPCQHRAERPQRLEVFFGHVACERRGRKRMAESLDAGQEGSSLEGTEVQPETTYLSRTATARSLTALRRGTVPAQARRRHRADRRDETKSAAKAPRATR